MYNKRNSIPKMSLQKISRISQKLATQHKKKSFPYVKISTREAQQEILNLKSMNYKDLISRQTGVIQFANNFKYRGKKMFMIQQSSIGNKISNKFFQKERMKASMASHPSPLEVWRDDVKRARLFSGMIKLNKHSPSKNEAQLRSSMRLYFSVVSQFKVSVAKCVYEYFDANHVLDFSAGWGDRLTAFLSCEKTISYTGFDPNTNLKKCYDELMTLHNTDKTVNMIYKPAEAVSLKRHYDMIFTSPPYFELEKYSNDKNQSHVKYSDLDNWFDNFLFKVLSHNLKYLKGTLALQISDYKKGSKTICLVKPLQTFMKENFANFTYKGYICVKTKGRFANTIVEPIFIWQNL